MPPKNASFPKPFTEVAVDQVASLGEVALISAIRTWLGDASPPAPWGIGDDCAVLPVHSTTPNAGASSLLTVDALVLGRHFDDSHPPEKVGAKLLKRNLSDLAAMGGRPTAAVIALALAPNLSIDWLKQFYQGLATTARRYDCPIVGGDITEDDCGRFATNLTLLGTAPRPILRSTAQVGDTVWVTGALGGSLRGWHLDFEPRLREGAWLAQTGKVTAMMDVSDGLAKDLPSLLGDDKIAQLDVSRIPIAPDAKTLATLDGRSPLNHAFCDGEDYELLFTVAAGVDAQDFLYEFSKHHSTPLTCIGTLAVRQPSHSHLLYNRDNSIPLDFQGFRHLTRESR